MGSNQKSVFFDNSNLGTRFIGYTISKLPDDLSLQFRARIPYIGVRPLFLYIHAKGFKLRGAVAAALGNVCYSNGLSVFFCYLDDASAARRKSWKGDDADFVRIKEVDFLILDGFDSTEPVAPIIETLEEIIRYRLRFGKHTVILSELVMRGRGTAGFQTAFERIGKTIAQEFERWERKDEQ